MFQSIIEQNLDELLGTEISIRDPIDPSSNFHPGIVYDIGRMWLKILKKFLIPGTALTAVQSEDDSADISGSKKALIKPSELPIYTDDYCLPRESPCPKGRTSLEDTISIVRQELWVWFDHYKGYRQKVVEVVETGKSHTEASLEYLKEESNYLPRVGAIGVGGVAGFIFGMRGGMARRLLSASAGSLTMAMFCYPRHVSDISKEALIVAKKGIIITYNFIHGDKQERKDENVGAKVEKAELPPPPPPSPPPPCYCPDPSTTGHAPPCKD